MKKIDKKFEKKKSLETFKNYIEWSRWEWNRRITVGLNDQKTI